MPNRTYFVPQSYKLHSVLWDWAADTFDVSLDEVQRQLDLMRDHEFRRPYSCWDRVFRNWMRKADELGTLRRERKLRQPDELTDDERQQDLLKWREDMRAKGIDPDNVQPIRRKR